MIEREIAPHLRAMFHSYPAVTVTGPRQSGKTTLCRSVFPDLPYVNLEAPDDREFAVQDPRGFLARYREGAIIDEVQRVPGLTSYLQVHIDEVGENGLYVLTGSQLLEVSQTVTQSLAGRTAVLRLLPFSMAEIDRIGGSTDIDTLLYTGFYPRIYDQDLNPTQALSDYFETYVERDLRQLSELRNLSAFHRFVRICAGRVGQLLNAQSLGADVGVSHSTAKAWLSLLEASYVVFLLNPFHGNVSKRLIKSPKLYFYDVGLAAYLLGIENARQMTTHPLRGQLFENAAVVEALKYRYNAGKSNNLHFYRDRSGNEVDLIYSLAQHSVPVEVKAGQTVATDFFRGLDQFEKAAGQSLYGRVLVYGADMEQSRARTRIVGLSSMAQTLSELDQLSSTGS